MWTQTDALTSKKWHHSILKLISTNKSCVYGEVEIIYLPICLSWNSHNSILPTVATPHPKRFNKNYMISSSRSPKTNKKDKYI